MTFKKTRTGQVLRGTTFVPDDDRNRDRAAYQAFVAGGGTPALEQQDIAVERGIYRKRVEALADEQAKKALVLDSNLRARVAEADQVIADDAASKVTPEADIPLISARVAASGETELAAAQAIRAEFDSAVTTWRKIEAAKSGALKAIDAATDAEQLETVVAGINWAADVPAPAPK